MCTRSVSCSPLRIARDDGDPPRHQLRRRTRIRHRALGAGAPGRSRSRRLIGATIGFTLVFVLARRLGRPIVERLFSRSIVAKYDDLVRRRGPLVLFLIYLLPAFPDDVISFIAGLTPIRLRTLILVSLAGRLPGYVVLNWAGDGLSQENMNPIIAAAAFVVVVGAIAIVKRAWIVAFVEHDDRLRFLRETWAASPRAITLGIAGILVLALVLLQLALVVPVQQ
ncbi:TVP38/TMEM64 family protein [Pseudolysinimonas sp.]